MNTPSVTYLAIDLPRSAERRAMLAEQAQKAGISISIGPAISGAELTEGQKAMYDIRKRASMYTAGLPPNEQACVHSHLKALRTFLDTGAEYGVVLEDDVLLPPDFSVGIRYLTEQVHGWQVVRLYTDNSKMYPVCPAVPGAPLQPAFPKKVLWGSVGYLYTRTGAQRLLQHLTRIWMAADAMLATTMLEHGIPVIGVVPNLAGTAFPANEQSDIDDGCPRRQQNRLHRSLPMYLRYRAHVIRTAILKARMRSLLRRTISITQP